MCRSISTYDIDKIVNSSFYRAIRLELGDINNEIQAEAISITDCML